MVSEQFRRGASTPRRSRRAYYSRRRRQRLGAAPTSSGFRSMSPQFMRRVKNRPALRHRGYLHAMIRPIVVASLLSALAYGAYYGYQRALTSPALSIQSVRLHQVPNMLIEPVRARLKSAYGKNLLALDLVALRASIEELPAVRSAGVRRVLPDGLVVSIEARTPKVRVVGERHAYIIDRDGVVRYNDFHVGVDQADRLIRATLKSSPADGKESGAAFVRTASAALDRRP